MKTKTLASISFISILTISILISSCEKESLSPQKTSGKIYDLKIDNKNGVLHFASTEDFFRAADILEKMTPEEIAAWEKELNFVSLRSQINTALTEFEKAETESEYNRLLLKYDNIIKKTEDSYKPIVDFHLYTIIANPEGLFYVEGVLHKITENHIITVKDGDRNKLPEMASEIKSNNENINIFQFFDENSKANCGTNKSVFYQDSDRRINMQISVYRYSCEGCCGNYFNQIKVDFKLWGEKKNVWGNWKQYKTQLEFRKGGFEILAPKVYGYNGVHSLYNEVTYTVDNLSGNSVNDYNSITWTYNVGDQVQNITLNNPTFLKVKGEAKSRGTGLCGWAVACCGYTNSDCPNGCNN